jgi:propionyl-CoA carboxylase alpha chain
VLSRVLVANRGEIARRVFRTCHDLGLGTVAVYSDADDGAPHVLAADAAVRLPGSAPADTYLRADLLVEAAVRAGADAVHPGYGFLAENAAFARAVCDAGLTWVGPPPDAIEAMGSKTVAKRLMAAAGVPVLPELRPDALTESGLPVLIKASAGGGGRGMRIVRSLADLPGALASARAEAESAFGDPEVFCEPYIEAGRHIEVQVLADSAGTIWTIGERECSIQRRHQKIIEETPSPLVERTAGLRDRLFEASRAAAAAVGYVNAGTVEFLADEAGQFYFLEMNTRLQVEHPVTECVTGLDLVALQLQIAAGAELADSGGPAGSAGPLPSGPPSGHAIEARLYAEDPAAGWQPQSGTLHRFELPGAAAEFAVPAHRPAQQAKAVLRLDSGVVTGSQVSVYYDPMLAKVIAWAPERDQAAAVLAAALARAKIHGLVTNRDLLVRVLRHPAFLAGQTDTSFFDTHGLAQLAAPLADENAARLSALAAALADAAGRQAVARRSAAPVLGMLPSGWRNVPSQLQRKRYEHAGEQLDVGYRIDRGRLIVDLGSPGGVSRESTAQDIKLISMSPGLVELEIAGVRRRFEVAVYPGLVCTDSALAPVTLAPVSRFPDPAARLAAGSLLAPMPGTVARIAVTVGERVSAGQPLLWLEAMKMEHVLAAPLAGVVAELPAAAGQQVEVGSVLAIVKPEEEAP